MAKKKIDKGRLAIKIIAGICAGIMVIAFGGTLIFYLMAM